MDRRWKCVKSFSVRIGDQGSSSPVGERWFVCSISRVFRERRWSELGSGHAAVRSGLASVHPANCLKSFHEHVKPRAVSLVDRQQWKTVLRRSRWCVRCRQQREGALRDAKEMVQQKKRDIAEALSRGHEVILWRVHQVLKIFHVGFESQTVCKVFIGSSKLDSLRLFWGSSASPPRRKCRVLCFCPMDLFPGKKTKQSFVRFDVVLAGVGNGACLSQRHT